MERSPADVLRLAVAAVSLVLLTLISWLFGDTLVGFGSDLLRGLDALPDWLVRGFAVASRVIGVIVLVGGLVVTAVRTGWRMVGTVVLGIGVAVLLVVLLADFPDIDEGDVVTQVQSGLGPLTDRGFPKPEGIAALAAALTASAPWLSRSWRRWGWVAVTGSRAHEVPRLPDVVRHLGGRPGRLVRRGRRARRPRRPAAASDGRGHQGGLGRQWVALGVAQGGERGCTRLDARTSAPAATGRSYFVKALGDDQRSADLLFRLYRSIQRHDLGDERPFSSLRRAVEHEAFLALAVRDLDILTPRDAGLRVGRTQRLRARLRGRRGRSLDGVAAEEITDDVLADVWRQLGRLRSFRIAHRDLRLANIFLGDDGQIWMIDFGFSEIAASDLCSPTTSPSWWPRRA